MIDGGKSTAGDDVRHLERLDSRRRVGTWVMYGALAVPCLLFLVQLGFLVAYLLQGGTLPLPLGTAWTAPALLGGLSLIGALLVMPVGALVRGIYSRRISKTALATGMTSASRLPELQSGEKLGWTRVLTASGSELSLARPRFVFLMGVAKLFAAAMCTAFACWVAYQMIAGNASGRIAYGIVTIGAMLVAVTSLLAPVCLQWLATTEAGALSAELVRMCFFRSEVQVASENIVLFELRSGILRVYGGAVTAAGKQPRADSTVVPSIVIPLLRAGYGELSEVRSQRVIQSLLAVLQLHEEYRYRIVAKDSVVEKQVSATSLVMSTAHESPDVARRP